MLSLRSSLLGLTAAAILLSLNLISPASAISQIDSINVQWDCTLNTNQFGSFYGANITINGNFDDDDGGSWDLFRISFEDGNGLDLGNSGTGVLTGSTIYQQQWAIPSVSLGIDPASIRSPITIKIYEASAGHVQGALLESIVVDSPCFPAALVIDDRLQKNLAAPVIVYLNDHYDTEEGITLRSPEGNILATITAEEIGAIGVPENENVLIEQGGNPTTGQAFALYRLTTGEFQLTTKYADGKDYVIVIRENGDYYYLHY